MKNMTIDERKRAVRSAQRRLLDLLDDIPKDVVFSGDRDTIHLGLHNAREHLCLAQEGLNLAYDLDLHASD